MSKIFERCLYDRIYKNIGKYYEDFRWEKQELSQIPEGTILCTLDVVGRYINIPHDESLTFLQRWAVRLTNRSRQSLL